MTMILFNDSVEHRSESFIRLMTASINTDARINILTAREDGCLEWESTGISSVLQLIPDLAVEILA